MTFRIYSQSLVIIVCDTVYNYSIFDHCIYSYHFMHFVYHHDFRGLCGVGWG